MLGILIRDHNSLFEYLGDCYEQRYR